MFQGGVLQIERDEELRCDRRAETHIGIICGCNPHKSIGGGGGIRFPLTRIAVPTFFIISSFFLQMKMNTAKSMEKRRILKDFSKRIIRLYFSWFLLCAPITLHVRDYYRGGFLSACKEMFMDVLFGKAFLASWYLIALVVGVLIVYCLSDFLSDAKVILICAIPYALCCLMSNYGNLFLEGNLLIIVRDAWRNLGRTAFYNSFPAALLWVAIGKALANCNKSRMQSIPISMKATGLLLSLILLYLEHYFIQRMNASYATDCYFMLIPVSIALFVFALSLNLKVNNARTIRKMSTVMYCGHTTIGKCIGSIMSRCGLNLNHWLPALLRYGMVIVSCIAFTLFIMWIVKKSRSRFVRAARYLLN